MLTLDIRFQRPVLYPTTHAPRFLAKPQAEVAIFPAPARVSGSSF